MRIGAGTTSACDGRTMIIFGAGIGSTLVEQLFKLITSRARLRK